MLAAAATAWPLVCATQPLNTLAFVVDGLLFGASDFSFCAAMFCAAALPALVLMRLGSGLRTVWVALGTFMAMRALLGGARIVSGRGPWRLLRSRGQER